MQNVPRKPRRWRRAILGWARRTKHAGTMVRAQVIALVAIGGKAAAIAEALGCVRSHVYRTTRRFAEHGWSGLLDARKANGKRKADGAFHETVRQLLLGSPRDHGYIRPTWTRELLILVAESKTSVRVSPSVMGRVLRSIGARRGRPKPIVKCPLSDRQKRRRLQEIRELVESLPRNEVAVYEDEVDIHLNPKIGLDWMNKGEQKLVMTPGKNQKAYLAGALDARDGTVVWAGAAEKNSALFVALLERLEQHYSTAKRIHVILDNYGIHSSHEVRAALQRLSRIRLHFLPPYSPDHNRIERLWLDLHANVTRNHQHTDLVELCQDVVRFLKAVTPWLPRARPLALKAA